MTDVPEWRDRSRTVVFVEITKAYFMLPVRDMERAVFFYRDIVGLTVELHSPFWSELRWREATIALHGGGAAEERDSWLGFHVSDFDAALAEGGARLVSVVDPEGNAFTLGQDVS